MIFVKFKLFLVDITPFELKFKQKFNFYTDLILKTV